MKAIDFPESNFQFGPPPGLEESQVRTVPAFVGTADQGSVEGSRLVVVCHQPDDRERAAIAAGGPIFLTVMGNLPPHFLTTNFPEATNPA